MLCWRSVLRPVHSLLPTPNWSPAPVPTAVEKTLGYGGEHTHLM